MADIHTQNLTAIADAIREKDGTTAPILASTFPERIKAIKAGADIPACRVSIKNSSGQPKFVYYSYVSSEGALLHGEREINNSYSVTITVAANSYFCITNDLNDATTTAFSLTNQTDLNLLNLEKNVAVLSTTSETGSVTIT